jgi:multidrug efflux pump subunit AcrB
MARSLAVAQVRTHPKVMGVLSIFPTSTDIFPSINIPVVSIISSFNGMVPKDMSDRS